MKTNKNKKIKKRTIKYFIQQKAFELLYLPLIVIMWIIFAQFGYLINQISGDPIHPLSTFLDYIMHGIAGIFMSVIIIVILFVIYKLLEGWIESNWTEATRRARKDFK